MIRSGKPSYRKRHIAKLLDEHRDSGRFDLVIADEVQDLLHPPYLDVLELVLKGGLAGGSMAACSATSSGRCYTGKVATRSRS